ncbi:hypothetical protein BJX66DRAFT_10726 [Aspergillus keveii]|uniref:Uncharacterized protein n=1 Tax=Aspergillus keveii TaxID=714993 RepID=A0ABR4GQQ5_9EURO
MTQRSPTAGSWTALFVCDKRLGTLQEKEKTPLSMLVGERRRCRRSTENRLQLIDQRPVTFIFQLALLLRAETMSHSE